MGKKVLDTHLNDVGLLAHCEGQDPNLQLSSSYKDGLDTFLVLMNQNNMVIPHRFRLMTYRCDRFSV